jgi:hemolysin activation/secretion protein
VYYLKTGGATLAGTPEFYQLNVIGGGQTLRGYRRFRFYGKTIFYAQNEIQWIRPVRGNLFNGKAGLLALTDLGRVWYPGEKSNKLHIAFGAGFILSPFNKISVAATYARSKEDGTVNFRFGRTF